MGSFVFGLYILLEMNVLLNVFACMYGQQALYKYLALLK